MILHELLLSKISINLSFAEHPINDDTNSIILIIIMKNINQPELCWASQRITFYRLRDRRLHWKFFSLKLKASFATPPREKLSYSHLLCQNYVTLCDLVPNLTLLVSPEKKYMRVEVISNNWKLKIRIWFVMPTFRSTFGNDTPSRLKQVSVNFKTSTKSINQNFHLQIFHKL